MAIKKYSMIGLLLLWCCGSLAIAAPALEAKVDHNPIALNETVNLNIIYSGQASDNINLAPLIHDFDVLGQAQNNQITILNGTTQVQTQWLVQLAPKHTGDLIIPAITINGESTAPITVKVQMQAPAKSAKQNDKSVFIETSLSSKSPYVQSQVLYKVKLFIPANMVNSITSAHLNPPTADGVTIKQVDNTAGYSVMRNNQYYKVYEMHYALFPQKSGEIAVTPVEFKGDMLVSPKRSSGDLLDDDENLFSGAIKPIIVNDEPFMLHVLPIPTTFSGGAWLPAKSLSLEEKWSAKLTDVRVGQALTRTIMIKAVGVTAAQLPEPKVDEVKDINVYPDIPVSHTDSNGTDVTSQREIKIAYVPTQAGTISLPEIKIPWWNTETNTMQVATLPAKTLTILTANGATATTIPSASAEPSLTTATTVIPKQQPAAVPEFSKNKFNWVWLLAGALLIMWLTTIALWWHSRSNKLSAAQKIFQKVKKSQGRLARRKIKQACYKNDPAALKASLLAWAEEYWPNKSILTLGHIRYYVNDKELRKAIKRLDFVLYAEGKSTFDGKAFWKIFLYYLKRARQKVKKQRDPLPTLYPR
jgi:hypothetical protein